MGSWRLAVRSVKVNIDCENLTEVIETSAFLNAAAPAKQETVAIERSFQLFPNEPSRSGKTSRANINLIFSVF